MGMVARIYEVYSLYYESTRGTSSNTRKVGDSCSKQLYKANIGMDSLVALSLLTNNINVKLNFFIYKVKIFDTENGIREIATYFQRRQSNSRQIGIMGRISKISPVSLLETPPITLTDWLKNDEGPGTRIRFVRKGTG